MSDQGVSGGEKSVSAVAVPPAGWRERSARVREWFTGQRALAALQASEPQRDAAAIGHAKAALALAERAIDPSNPLREGGAAALVVGLYAQATYWLLQASHEQPFAEPTPAGAFVESSPALLLRAAGDEGTLRAVRRSLAEQSFVTTAAAGAEEQSADARAARAFVLSLLEAVERQSQGVRRLYRRRYARVVGSLLAALVLIVGANAALERALRTPDLAAGKPWRASSSYATCEPAQHTCAGSATDILFHTDLEKSPWFEIDLGAPTKFSKVVLFNRTDCCAERAYPIAVEVSSDARAWKGVAQRSSVYERWTAKFPSENARYVRVRALKKTYLHLNRVEVHLR